MALYLNYNVSKVPHKTNDFSLAEREFANTVALQAYNMNCNEVHIDTPSRIGNSVFTVGAGGEYPIDVHFHGKKNNNQYKINNSTITFIMTPKIKVKPKNTFTSYGIKFKV